MPVGLDTGLTCFGLCPSCPPSPSLQAGGRGKRLTSEERAEREAAKEADKLRRAEERQRAKEDKEAAKEADKERKKQEKVGLRWGEVAVGRWHAEVRLLPGGRQQRLWITCLDVSGAGKTRSAGGCTARF